MIFDRAEIELGNPNVGWETRVHSFLQEQYFIFQSLCLELGMSNEEEVRLVGDEGECEILAILWGPFVPSEN